MTSFVKMQLFDLEKGAQQPHPSSKQSTGLNSRTCAASAQEACLVAQGVLGVTSLKHNPSQCLEEPLDTAEARKVVVLSSMSPVL